MKGALTQHDGTFQPPPPGTAPRRIEVEVGRGLLKAVLVLSLVLLAAILGVLAWLAWRLT